MIAELFALSSRGEALFHKKYRADVHQNTIEVFSKRISESKSSTHLLPLVSEDHVYFYHIKRNSIYFVATTKADVSSILVIETLTRLYHLCKDFCGLVSEESLRTNIILLYELLDDFMDNGYVQLSSTEKLKSYIQSDPVAIRPARTPDNMTSGLEQRKNEIFVDVVERLSVLVDSSGNLVRSEISGKVKMKCFLDGTPTIRLGLNEDLVTGKGHQIAYGGQAYLSHCTFHDCVKLDEFEENKTLLIYPPEGEFSAMTYTHQEEAYQAQPIKVLHFIDDTDINKDLELIVKLRCEIPAQAHAINVSAVIPVPKATTNMIPQLTGPGQTAEFIQKEKRIKWTLKKIFGGSETTVKFKLNIPNRTKAYHLELGPMALDFEISGHVPSGVNIRFLKVFDKDATFIPHRWIRYITVPDSYIIRF
ncbi:uncharacterized protein LOC135485702 isoform X2 [Lineus longissimus]|uniref:uncharacterized protein LOC135485702 isoform X2 n=1 Tax=Lineus longissimus TaxID=88925 RepID=UPI00315DCC0F